MDESEAVAQHGAMNGGSAHQRHEIQGHDGIDAQHEQGEHQRDDAHHRGRAANGLRRAGSSMTGWLSMAQKYPFSSNFIPAYEDDHDR